jgi:hypothetical protein
MRVATRTLATGIAIVLAVLGLAAGIGAFAWAHHVRPLGGGSLELTPHVDGIGYATTKSLASGPSDYELRYRTGATVTFGFSIRNKTGRDIRISRAVAPDRDFVFAVDRVRLNPDDAHPGVPGDPFKPFTLKAHAERAIFVEAHFRPCLALEAGGAAILEGEFVETDILGVRHDQWVPLHTPIAVLGPGQDCPTGKPSP